MVLTFVFLDRQISLLILTLYGIWCLNVNNGAFVKMHYTVLFSVAFITLNGAFLTKDGALN